MDLNITQRAQKLRTWRIGRARQPLRVVLVAPEGAFLVDTEFFVSHGYQAAREPFERAESAAIRLVRAAISEAPAEGSTELRELTVPGAQPTTFIFWFAPEDWSLEWSPRLRGFLVNVAEQAALEAGQRHGKMAALAQLLRKVAGERRVTRAF